MIECFSWWFLLSFNNQRGEAAEAFLSCKGNCSQWFVAKRVELAEVAQ